MKTLKFAFKIYWLLESDDFIKFSFNWNISSTESPLLCKIFLGQSECLQIWLVNSGMSLSFNKSAKSDLQFRLFWPQAKESIYGKKFQSIFHNSKIPNIPIFPSKLLKSCGISNQVNAPLIKEVCYAWFIFFEWHLG